jgi:hypothetical protein
MSDQEEQPFDHKTLEAMNEKAIQNQFFTPDNVYIELELFKDIPLGIMYAGCLGLPNPEEEFGKIQKAALACVKDYQQRTYETIDPFFSNIGYTDDRLDRTLKEMEDHDKVFVFSPATKFLDLIIRHTVRNQNNSRPAAKYVKRMVDHDQYTMDAVPVTYYINTFPLNLTPKVLASLSVELGESFGVNISFLNQDPGTFGQTEWDLWLKKIDCFYFSSLGRFTRGDFVNKKQGDLEFAGCYFFARKRFEKSVMPAMRHLDFAHQVQLITAQIDMMCDFAWIQNNDVRLTEEGESVPVDEPEINDEDRTDP